MNMSKLIGKCEEWDELDQLFYTTGSWIWFWMPISYLIEKINENAFWYVVHSYCKSFEKASEK